MPTKLHLGDESQIKMPDMFAHTDITALRRAQLGRQASSPGSGEQYRDVKLSAVVGDSPLQLRAPFDPQHDEDDAALLASLESDGQRAARPAVARRTPRAIRGGQVANDRVPVLLVEDLNSQAPAFTILDGHRRIAALRHLKRESVKAVIFNQGTLECDLITLTANVRKRLTPLEQARAITRLCERHHLTVEAIARRVGLSTRYIGELKALLKTDPAIQAALERGEIKAKAALALGQAPCEHQPKLAEIAAAHGLSEADAKRLVDRVRDTGETPEQAAQALGVGVESGSTDPATSSSESTASTEPGAPPVTPARKSKPGRKRGQALTMEAAVTLIQGSFPEIEARAIHSLAEVAVKQSATANVLKAATLLTLGGMQMEKALSSAWATANDPAARKLLRVVDVFVDVRALIGKGRAAPECAPILAALAKQAMGLKQLLARMKKNTKGTRRGTPQSAE